MNGGASGVLSGGHLCEPELFQLEHLDATRVRKLPLQPKDRLTRGVVIAFRPRQASIQRSGVGRH